ncbi:MAG: class I SAM-dependent methyltransferase [Acidobacteriota bacterium]|nr:class I SAM-dependent methyltransferase [Acidobacteriota bacterium]
MTNESNYLLKLDMPSAASGERQLFTSKFNSLTLIEKWRELPTSTNIQAFTARAAVAVHNARVLDLCCGTGKGSIELVNNWSVGEVVYIDQSSVALEMAQEVFKNSARSSLVSTRFVCQSAELLDNVEDLGMFDTIIIRYALHLVSDPVTLLSRLYHRLRPGGRIVFNLAGSNIFRFCDPSFNAIPDSSGRAHPFFLAVYRAALILREEILSAVPRDEQESVLLTETKANGGTNETYCINYPIGTQFDLRAIREIVVRAGIPLSKFSYEVTWLRASFEDKAAYASVLGAPPIPKIWQLFNAMHPSHRNELVQKVMRVAGESLPASSRFYFPEPIFTIYN